MKELEDFIKYQYETFEHFDNVIKENKDNLNIVKSLNEKQWFLNRLIQLAVIIKAQLIGNQKHT